MHTETGSKIGVGAIIPPVRTPKSQPVVEQPLTGEFLSPPKRQKTKRDCNGD